MLKAIIFDFDGIIADTEPIHLEAFKIVLKEHGIELSEDAYFKKYLAFDDKTLFKKIFDDNGKACSASFISNLIDVKHLLINDLFKSRVKLFPGFTDFFELIKDRYVLSIASGALKSEIEFILNKYGLLNYFQNITAADEVLKCKPDPESFNTSLQKINRPRESEIHPYECLVIEDSVYGVEAAKSANMNCIAITNSYGRELLKSADLIVDSFSEINLKVLDGFATSR